jgi:hypothetical protein
VAVTVRQLKDRIRELQLFQYRKKTRTGVPKGENTGPAIQWVAERIDAINKEMAELEKKNAN